MGKFKFNETSIEGVYIIEPTVFGDERGYFMETYQKEEFKNAGIDQDFVQDNQSKSTKGVIRGLHFQYTKPQGKLVRVINGEVFDVAVDLRPNSPTFGKWEKVELSEENRYMFFIPEGFAHGFVVLSDEAELIYKTNTEYSPQHDRGVLWCDNDINVDWGIENPILSEKDKVQPTLAELKQGELLCDCWSQAAQGS